MISNNFVYAWIWKGRAYMDICISYNLIMFNFDYSLTAIRDVKLTLHCDTT